MKHFNQFLFKTFFRCSTAVDSEGFHTLGREFWGHCSSDCPNDKSGVEIEKIKGEKNLIVI